MAKKYDAILIAGGGVRQGGRLPEWSKRRLDKAVEVAKGEYLITLSAGTTHKPPLLDKNGFVIFEAVAEGKYLIKQGIRPEKVLPENVSYDTIGNAYFARLIHIEPRRFKKLLVITSQFHLPRTKAIFNWIFSLSVPKNYYQLDFLAVSDAGFNKKLLAARIEKEKQSLTNFKKTIKKIKNLKQLHNWLFTEHDAYAINKIPKRAKGILLKGY